MNKAKLFLHNLVKYKMLLLFCTPGLIMLFINAYLPMAGVLMAFKKIDNRVGIFKSPWVGFGNFKYLFMSDLWGITLNTILFNLVFIFGGLILSVTIALVINELRNRLLSKLYQTIIIMPNFLSMVVVGYLVYGFLGPQYGIVNNVILPQLHMEAIDWYTEPKYWIFILPIVNFWIGCGMGSVIYLASLTGIDNSLYESATIDGATKFQQTRYISMPMLAPVITVLTILSLGGIIRGNFGLFYQVPLNSPQLYQVTQIIDTFVYRALMTHSDYGMSTAAGLYQSVIGSLMLIICNSVVKKISPSDAIF